VNDVGTYPANGRPPFCVSSLGKQSCHPIHPHGGSRLRSDFHRLPISASFVTIVTNHARFETDTVFYRDSEYVEPPMCNQITGQERSTGDVGVSTSDWPRKRAGRIPSPLYSSAMVPQLVLLCRDVASELWRIEISDSERV
jgi:hypothetical protein